MSGIKSFRSRVNSAMRRSSSAFSVRPSTPAKGDAASISDTSSLQQSSEPGSLTQLDTTLPPPKFSAAVIAPSPIAESPSREAAAEQEHGPSNLGLTSLVAEPEGEDSPAANSGQAQAETETNAGVVLEVPVPLPQTSAPPAWITESEGVVSGPTSNEPHDKKVTPQMSRASLTGGSAVWKSQNEQEPAGVPDIGSSAWDFSTDSQTQMQAQPPTEDPFADDNAVKAVGFDVQMLNEETVSKRPSYLDADAASMALPKKDDVIQPRSLRNIPSNVSLVERVGRPAELDVNETRPLLSRSSTPHPYRPPYTSSSQPQVSTSLLHSLGWLEYVLPDGTAYYVHPTLRLTTDIDLRVQKNVQAMEGERGRCAGKGWEVWLREAGKVKGRGKGKGTFMRMWVDHTARSVSSEAPGEFDSGAASEDRLDREYRYWSYMEAHPAHTALPPGARTEAMDALTWSYTDRLLPGQRSVPPPFAQAECQELMNLLRSFDASTQDVDKEIQSIVHTRIVSRILLRVSHWRQLHFRSGKPLRTRPIRRAVLDFFFSCLFLGIPLIFASRRIDEENGSGNASGVRSAGPVLVIGASTCLTAAVVLSASVTFVSLPGLDSLSRVAGLVSILCATGTMVTSAIALTRYRADVQVQRDAVVGGEGLNLLTKRTVTLSLPLVFLAYSLGALIAGIVLYSFRGVSVVDSGAITRQFEAYTKWTVAGTLGGLVGLIFVSSMLARR